MGRVACDVISGFLRRVLACVKIVAECKGDVLLEAVAIQDA